MPMHAERKTVNRKYWKPIAVMGLFAVVFVFYLAGVENDQSATPAENSLTDGAAVIPTSELATAADSLASRDQNSIRQIESDEIAESPSDGQFDLTGLSEEEVRLLHARQQFEIGEILDDLDAIVFGSENGDGTGMTVRELRSLHEQQQLELASGYDGQVIIPASEDGSPELTVANLRTLHERQEQDYQASHSPDDIMFVPSENGTIGPTIAELDALHRRQRIEIENDSEPMYKIVAPVPGDGSSFTTVEQVLELHKSQSQD